MSASPASSRAARPPRRLPRDARREQLVAAAVPVAAERGFADFSLDEVAARADVTRNLLYHYFPRGRRDVVLAVVERAGEELTRDWVTDEKLPLAERLRANFARIAAHALAPTDAWRIHRQAAASADPELAEIGGPFVELVISSIARNHLGTPDPPPLVRLALRGYLALTETVLDEARERGTAPDAVMQMLSEILTATIAAATSAG